jgi:hypothetical protein
MVALIAIHELIGPVLFRAALARAGEIGRMDTESLIPHPSSGESWDQLNPRIS